MKFTGIGFATNRPTKAGKPGIVLNLDPASRLAMDSNGYSHGIWLFPSQYGYSVAAPVQDNYQFTKPVSPVKEVK